MIGSLSSLPMLRIKKGSRGRDHGMLMGLMLCFLPGYLSLTHTPPALIGLTSGLEFPVYCGNFGSMIRWLAYLNLWTM